MAVIGANVQTGRVCWIHEGQWDQCCQSAYCFKQLEFGADDRYYHIPPCSLQLVDQYPVLGQANDSHMVLLKTCYQSGLGKLHCPALYVWRPELGQGLSQFVRPRRIYRTSADVRRDISPRPRSSSIVYSDRQYVR
jgi:hypothetical protein